MRNIFYACTIAAACLATTPALAADAKLSWKDLDLTTDAGKAELDRRIDTAAHEVCAVETITGSRVARKPSASCVAEARSEMSAQVAAKVAAKTERNRMAAQANAVTAAR